MKKTILVLLSLMIVALGISQEEKTRTTQEMRTIFNGNKNNNKIIHGGYGGILLNYSQVDNKDAFLAGIRGVWLINHGIGIGIGGYGFANELRFEKQNDDKDNPYSLAGGYGGLIIEPVIGAKLPVHVSFPVLIGAGGVANIREQWSIYNDPSANYYSEDAAAYFVVEPGVEIELNLVKFFRIGLGCYYRYTTDVVLQTWNGNDYVDISPDLTGFSFGIALKFGKF
jgi:hypothetical protein